MTDLEDRASHLTILPGQTLGIAEWGYIDDRDLQHQEVSKRLERFEPIYTVRNQITNLWGKVTGPLLQGQALPLTTAYLEFSNTGSIVAPTPDRAGSREYYSNLNSSIATRDYLRVSLAAAGSANSDPDTYEEDNIFYFSGHSAGVEGVHGLPYSEAEDSTVYGGALVARRHVSNPSLDLIFARLYSPQAQQLPKIANRQVAFRWAVVFG